MDWSRRAHDLYFRERPDQERFSWMLHDPEWTYLCGTTADGDLVSPEARELVIGFAGASGNLGNSSPIFLRDVGAADARCAPRVRQRAAPCL